MVYLDSNIKLLRKRAKKSQGDLAEQLGVSRAVLNSYENRIANPPLELLVKISRHFGLSVDVLLKTDLAKLHELQLRQLEASEGSKMVNG
ncbi:helix-turn-helix transcriptional regulator [Solitalea koreensis]|uniref:DNA-binding transcriptional regulator, XRE-family HTH domain n=1 Tax=Solitalea koreensis TaxID=543615 RepID=A0A521D2F2_9SPHI|nr:helix-turn-helix transcriptional regulator [Solitalea koreensis]SMO65832.1 DNA-binding transcriptional regulator, XRE-family HTH domain [Solitalea koreensis]